MFNLNWLCKMIIVGKRVKKERLIFTMFDETSRKCISVNLCAWIRSLWANFTTKQT